MCNSSQIIDLSCGELKPSSEFLILSCSIREVLIKVGDPSAGLDFIFLSDDGLKFEDFSFEGLVFVLEIEDFSFEVLILVLELVDFGIRVGDSFGGLTELKLEPSSEFLIFLIEASVGLLGIL